MPLCHLISAVDPIEAADNVKPIRDGLPETLPEWINHNGLNHFKIKLNGNDLSWDLDRVLRIDRATIETQKKRGFDDWAYVLDFNEKCPNVDYYLTFLRRLKEKAPRAFSRIEYVEQPTARDLKAHPENTMHEAAKLCPVVIDESLIDVDSLFLARRLGWTGPATCAGPGGSRPGLKISMQEEEQTMNGTRQCVYAVFAVVLTMAAFSILRSVEARTYYVATSGDDHRSGTEAQPLGTIQKAASMARAGDGLRGQAPAARRPSGHRGV